MDPPAITTQPLPSLEKSEKPMTAVIDSNGDGYKQKLTGNGGENLEEVTTVFNNAGELEETTQEEKENRRERKREETDCCCVSPYYYADDTDVFCLYILCRWICDCFRGIGHCTEDCFEGCANCLGECCEGDACFSCDCDDGGDCLTVCAECCRACGECCSD